jgi:uncharacterized lipoprotein YddW (UPF0748 family)
MQNVTYLDNLTAVNDALAPSYSGGGSDSSNTTMNALATGKSTLTAVWLPVSFRTSSYQKLNNVLLGLASQGVQRVYLSIWSGGVAYFKTQYLKLLFNKFSPVFGRDLLSWALTSAKPLGIEIIPWFELGFAASDSRNRNSSFADLARANDWVIGTYGGYEWMDPQNPDIISILSSIISEILGTYAPLGVRTIHFGETLGFPASLGGVDTSLTPVIRNLRSALLDTLLDMSSVAPIRISVSPHPLAESRAVYSVDWEDWATSGIIDEAVPLMISQGSDLAVFQATLDGTLSSISKQTLSLISAIGISLFQPNGTMISASLLREMVDEVHSKGLGVCILDGFTLVNQFADFVAIP